SSLRRIQAVNGWPITGIGWRRAVALPGGGRATTAGRVERQRGSLDGGLQRLERMHRLAHGPWRRRQAVAVTCRPCPLLRVKLPIVACAGDMPSIMIVASRLGGRLSSTRACRL